MDTNTLETFDDERIGWTKQRVIALLVVIALAAFWIWGFSPWAPYNKADGIHDKTFLTHAKADCKTMRDQLAALPTARSSRTANERADVIAQSGPILTTMVAELRRDAAGLTARDATLTTQWIDDWEEYSRNRQAYAAALRLDTHAQFTVTERNRGQITETMDGFSRVNDLASCLVPLDV